MDIKISLKEITVITSDGVQFGMTWDHLREIEKAIKTIRILQETVNIDKATITIT